MQGSCCLAKLYLARLEVPFAEGGDLVCSSSEVLKPPSPTPNSFMQSKYCSTRFAGLELCFLSTVGLVQQFRRGSQPLIPTPFSQGNKSLACFVDAYVVEFDTRFA